MSAGQPFVVLHVLLSARDRSATSDRRCRSAQAEKITESCARYVADRIRMSVCANALTVTLTADLRIGRAVNSGTNGGQFLVAWIASRVLRQIDVIAGGSVTGFTLHADVLPAPTTRRRSRWYDSRRSYPPNRRQGRASIIVPRWSGCQAASGDVPFGGQHHIIISPHFVQVALNMLPEPTT